MNTPDDKSAAEVKEYLARLITLAAEGLFLQQALRQALASPRGLTLDSFERELLAVRNSEAAKLVSSEGCWP